MAGVPAALARPEPSGVLTQWTPQPVAIAVLLLLAAGYLLGLRRLGRAWPAWRTAVFAAGLLALAWTSCGFLQVYGRSLFWAWTTQALLLWLVVPIIVLAGQPVQLARTGSGTDGMLARALRSPFCRVIGNPLVAPALVPLLSFVLFFGPLAGWTVQWPPLEWLVQLVLLVVGALLVLPLVGVDEDASSLAVGLSVAIGTFELVLDALPGVVLRLHNTLATSYFAHRAEWSWTPQPLHDQRVAGATLWCVAEIIDLPFLWLVFRRWVRADARDAAAADAVLEAERAARRALPDTAEPDRDEPWWLSDPVMRERLRRRE